MFLFTLYVSFLNWRSRTFNNVLLQADVETYTNDMCDVLLEKNNTFFQNDGNPSLNITVNVLKQQTVQTLLMCIM